MPKNVCNRILVALLVLSLMACGEFFFLRRNAEVRAAATHAANTQQVVYARHQAQADAAQRQQETQRKRVFLPHEKRKGPPAHESSTWQSYMP